MKTTTVIVMAMLVVFAAPALAGKPAGNLAGNVKIGWNLSGDVMPVPPYGSLDIPGSDEASKLNVNQPNGNTEVVLTGVMNGLNPSTTYTVYLSNGYIAFVPATINSNFTADFFVANIWASAYDINLTSGTAGYPAGGSYVYTWSGIASSITGNLFSLTAVYDANVGNPLVDGCTTHMTGTIAADGSISGDWDDNYPSTTGDRSGTWTAPAGTATQYTGNTGWPGLFTSTIQPFTFVTDEFGAGSWHVNMRDGDFSGPDTYTLSVWINEAGKTVLISNNFDVVVD